MQWVCQTVACVVLVVRGSGGVRGGGGVRWVSEEETTWKCWASCDVKCPLVGFEVVRCPLLVSARQGIGLSYWQEVR